MLSGNYLQQVTHLLYKCLIFGTNMAEYIQNVTNQHFKKFGTVVVNAILKKKLYMKTKFIFASILAVFVLSTSAIAQTGKTAKPATTKKGGNKKGATSAKGGKGTTASTSATSDTSKVAIPTSSKPGNAGKGNDGKPATGVVPGASAAVSADNPFKELIANAKPVLQETANGSINFTDEYVEAKGSSVIDNDRFKNPAQAKLMAERGAIVVAQRNLLEIVKGVSVIGETTVEDMITTGDYVYTRVEGVVKGAKQFGPSREEAGVITVTLRMPLYDKTNGVAAGFTPTSLANARKSSGLVEDAADVVNAVAGEQVIDGSKPIAFNIGGKTFDASMFPVIVDENGRVQLDFSKIYEKSGNIPKILNLGKDLMDASGFKKGADIIELIQDKATGKLTLADTTKKGKINWGKIADVAGKVGKVLLNILL